jgi:hypothetical protein
MNTGSSSSARSSAQTSRNKPKTPLGESQFLTEQASLASSAISSTIKQIQLDLLKGVDPRLWTKEHPWMTLAAATVGGFAATSVVVPSKEQQALKRLEKLERALHPNPDHNPDHAHDKKDRSILASIFSHGMGALQPILMSIITGAITGKVAQPDPDDLAAAQGTSGTPS